MERMSLRGEERGVSVVVGAILLLAIVVAVAPIIYRHYVKTSMTSNESAHMKRVRKQFLELQSKASWIMKNESETIRVPMNAEPVSFSIGQSPLGTLQTGHGSGIENSSSPKKENVEMVRNGTFSNGVKYWENEEVTSTGNPEASLSYDSEKGDGSILTHIKAEGAVTSTEEAYWYQPIGPIPSGDNIIVSGAFRKSIDVGTNGDNYNATVRIEVEDGENWATVWENTSTEDMDDWENFENIYPVQDEVDNIKCYMNASGSGGTVWQVWPPVLTTTTTTENLWMDNISAKAKVPVSENVTIDPGSIRFSGRNIYYPDQTYIFEGGHVILEQDNSEVMLEPTPSKIDCDNVNENRYKIEVEYPLISGENSSVSSRSEFIALARRGDINRNGLTENFTLFVETDYENVWGNYFNEVVSKMPPDLVDNDSAGIDNGNPYLSVGSENNLIEYSVRAENIKAVI